MPNVTSLYVSLFFAIVYIFGVITGATMASKHMFASAQPSVYSLKCDLRKPPFRYDHGPTPKYKIVIISREEMFKRFEDPLIFLYKKKIKFCGYTDVSVKPNVIYLWDKAVSPELIRHELGHVRGWRHPSILQRPASKND